MIQLSENEKIIIAVHRHWIVVARKMTLVILLLIPLIVILISVPLVPQKFAGLILYAVVIYFLFVLFLAFRSWIDYYLDMWILTDKRLIDIEQTGLFQREVSEIPLFRIQDMTVSIPGFTATFLKFGTIAVQTAGEKNFYIREISKVYEIKDLIMNQIQKNRENSF